MEIKFFQENKNVFTKEHVEKSLSLILKKNTIFFKKKFSKKIFNLIDLTSLKITDDENNIKKIVDKVNDFEKKFSNIPNVASICVYPSLVEFVKKHKKNENVKITSVAGAFPDSQTFLEIKKNEALIAIKKGADEIDMVMSIGKFLSKKYQEVFEEIRSMKKIVGDKHLKVILETGALKNMENIAKASFLAMQAGADFIKTSTGKFEKSADLESVFIMAKCINIFYQNTNKKIGLKPAGGISNTQESINYFLIVKETLGEEWLNNKYFRFGASSLANDLLSFIENKKIIYF